MIEFDSASHQEESGHTSMPVTVIGIGGAGINVLDTIALEGLCEARLVSLNTDIRALQNSMAGTKIQLGRELTQGLGAGGDPELGSEAARLSADQIRGAVLDQQVVFLCVGLGGGTGSGAAPLVARIAREQGAFVVVFAMMPFSFEGKRRVRQAREALAALRRQASALITFDNDRIGELVVAKKGIQDAFTAADKVVSQSIRALINLISRPGLIRIGMDDLITALRNHESRCLFGYGVARGEDRGPEALRQALKSPLLDRDEFRKRASNVLVHVCGGPQMTFFEVEELMTKLGDHLPEDAQILFGTGTDPRMADDLSVTILTSLGSHEEIEAQEQPLTPAALQPHLESPAPTISFTSPQESVAARSAPGESAEAQEPIEVVTPSSLSATEAAAAPHDLLELETPFVEPELASAAGGDPVAASTDEEWERHEAASDFIDESELVEARSEEAPPVPADDLDEPPGFEEAPADEDSEVTPTSEEETSELESAGDLNQPEPPLNPRKTFHLRDIALSKRRPGGTERPTQPSKPLIFQSWRREQARINSLPPQPPEKVEPVSDFEETSAPPPEPAAPPRAATRLPFFTGRAGDEGARKAAQEQATFDESLQSLSRGRFEKVEPTMEDGQDLDVPAFLRRRRK